MMPFSTNPVDGQPCWAIGTVVTPALGLIRLTCHNGARAAQIVGVKGVDTVVLSRNVYDVVHSGVNGHVRHVKRLTHNKTIDAVGKLLSKLRGINVAWSQQGF